MYEKKKKVLTRAMTYGSLCAEKLILGIEPISLKVNGAFFFLVYNLFLKILTFQCSAIESMLVSMY